MALATENLKPEQRVPTIDKEIGSKVLGEAGRDEDYGRHALERLSDGEDTGAGQFMSDMAVQEIMKNGHLSPKTQALLEGAALMHTFMKRRDERQAGQAEGTAEEARQKAAERAATVVAQTVEQP